MRNVTNNETAQAGDEEAKRGRGRPRKPDAMSNCALSCPKLAMH
jgi:hypothetical protein